MATIKDVAAEAGVSVGTASKALRGLGSLRLETRARVIETARRLGYEVNANAASLRHGRTYTVGLLTWDGYGRFTPQVMGGIEDALTSELVSVILCDARADVVRERHYLQSLIARRVDGVIVTGRSTNRRPPLGRRLPFPVVYAYTRSLEDGDAQVTVDDEHGGRLAASALAAAGRRRVAHITGPPQYVAVSDRIAGARTALAEHGLQLPDSLIRHVPWQESGGYAAVDDLLTAEPDVDGIFCGSDVLGRGVADRLRERGRRVPDDVAIVGFDNWEILAAATRPPLTSVDMNLYDIGFTAGRLLLDAIEGTTAPGVHRRMCALVTRQSCPTRPEPTSRPVTPDPGLVPEM